MWILLYHPPSVCDSTILRPSAIPPSSVRPSFHHPPSVPHSTILRPSVIPPSSFRLRCSLPRLFVLLPLVSVHPHPLFVHPHPLSVCPSILHLSVHHSSFRPSSISPSIIRLSVHPPPSSIVFKIPSVLLTIFSVVLNTSSVRSTTSSVCPFVLYFSVHPSSICPSPSSVFLLRLSVGPFSSSSILRLSCYSLEQRVIICQFLFPSSS